MIELTLSDIGTICGYLGTLWCVANLAWGLFRNDAIRVLIYGIGCFATALIALNVGGILNSETWALLGTAVFGTQAVYNAATLKAAWKVMLSGVLCLVSLLSYLGVWRWHRQSRMLWCPQSPSGEK